MSNLTIFKDPSALTTPRAKGTTTALAQSMVQSTSIRRIATNTNGTFKRIVGGEQIGNAIRGEFNCIIVDALPKVSRTFYAGKYDPNAKATLPDCWSNLGEKPEAAAKAPQASSCISCPQNVKGSGENGGRACRYQRRIAILVMGDPTGSHRSGGTSVVSGQYTCNPRPELTTIGLGSPIWEQNFFSAVSPVAWSM